MIKLLFIFIVAQQVYAYDCTPVDHKLIVKKNKRDYFETLKKMDRRLVFEDMLFVSTNGGDKKRLAYDLEYLEGTEVNKDQRAFYKLMTYTTEAKSDHPKKLNLSEVCDIYKKVTELPAK